MDPCLAIKLNDEKGNEYYNSELANNIATVCKNYVENGLGALNYAVCDFDAATDLVEMAQPIIDPQNFSKIDRAAAINFRHPLTFTEMVTLTTAVAQILFGGQQARSVEAQKPEDENAAQDINELLAWNDAKIGLYLQGWLWCWAAVVYNRGVWYETTAQDIGIELEPVEEDDISKKQIPLKNKDGSTKMRQGKPVMGYPKRTRFRTKPVYSGFHNHLDLVSPYDFICDPSLPVIRFQEGRYAGHRVMIPWIELVRRSKLDPSDDAYVVPSVVLKLKTQKGNTTTPTVIGGVQGPNTTRTWYERTMRGANAAGFGGVGTGLVPGSDAVNKDDGGTIECWNMTIRQKPSILGLYPEDENLELINMLTTSQGDVLSINVLPNKHNQFPYAVGEGKPNAHRQLTPGWALAIKPIQDRVDDLNITHSTAQKRMGNIYLVDQTKCDIANLLAPDKNGLMVMRTEAGRSATADECIKQIPVTDTTARYPDEMAMWIETAENTTGAHASVQGQTADPSQTATQFEGTQEMAMGRISSIARCLSEMAICPQTRRWVENLQQFMPSETMIRVTGQGSDFDPDNPPEKYRTIKKADIQAGFSVIAHDGSLPGADAKTIAAASRAIEAWSANPNLAAAFDNTIPGAFDPIRIFRELMKKSGLNTVKFSVTREQAQQNALSKAQSQGMPIQPVGQQQIAAPPPVDASGLPSAAQLPPTPTAEPPPPGATLPQ